MYLSLHNDWDDETARALWGPKVITMEELTTWFHDQVGPCNGFSPMEVENDLEARFVFECERGQLEIRFGVDGSTGEVEHLLAGARGINPPVHVRQAAEHLVALANGDPTFEPGIDSKLDTIDIQEVLAKIAARGPCKIDRVHLGSARGARFVLECDKGPMTLLVDLDAHGSLRRFSAVKGAADKWRNES